MKKPDFYPLKRAIEKFGHKTIIPWFIANTTRKYFDIQFKGLENLPETSAIMTPNHCINIDGIIVKSNLTKETNRLYHFWIQDEGVYSRSWKRKAFLWAMGEIPVKVDARSSNRAVLRRTYEHFDRNNDIIGIFSEGPSKDLIKNGKVIPLEDRVHFTGAANLSIGKVVPIVPVGITSSKEAERLTWSQEANAETNGKSFVKDYVKENGKIPYRINIGKPIHPHKYAFFSKKQARYEMTEDVKDRMLNLIYENRDEMWD